MAGKEVEQLLAETQALRVREVDKLISILLSRIQVTLCSLDRTTLRRILDLRQVLIADYRQSPALASTKLLGELAAVVEYELRPRFPMLSKNWNQKELLAHLTSTFGPREIEVRAEPYVVGAGLALRGFFCRTALSNRRKFLIFLNTAHFPAAVATTFGHELGHYLYGSMVGEHQPMSTLIEGDFIRHLKSESEFFADSLVALAAYPRPLIKLLGPAEDLRPGKAQSFLTRVKKAHDVVGSRFNFDFFANGMSAASRVRYLTSMIHFFKLRRALLDCAGL
jgi:hypothetical protein